MQTQSSAEQITQCPRCGGSNVIVFYAIPFVIHARGKGHFHIGKPFGNVDHHGIPDAAEAVCNASECGWLGKLKDAMGDGRSGASREQAA